MNELQKTGDEVTSQVLYKGTEYEDASWEVIGEVNDDLTFMPLSIEVVGQTDPALMVNPMFEDLGGLTPNDGKKRWHLPVGIEVRGGAQAIGVAEEDTEPTQTLKEAELNQMLLDAEARGRESGRLEAEAAHKEEVRMLQERIDVILQDLASQVRQEVGRHEKDAAQLAVTISEKVMNQAVEINPEYIIQIVHEALTLASGAHVAKVRVSPEDEEFIRVCGLEKIFQNPESSWKFESDPTIRAGCVVDTSAGEVDYQLDKAWERVRDNVVRTIK